VPTALPDVERWRRALHGTVVWTEGREDPVSTERHQISAPACVLYGTAGQRESMCCRSPPLTAGSAAEAVSPCGS
jgi:hypothetical protein